MFFFSLIHEDKLNNAIQEFLLVSVRLIFGGSFFFFFFLVSYILEGFIIAIIPLTHGSSQLISNARSWNNTYKYYGMVCHVENLQYATYTMP